MILGFPFVQVSPKFVLGTLLQALALPVEDVLAIHLILLPVGSVDFIPNFAVKSEVDMEVLVVVVMEDTVGLPRLPPLSLEVDPGVVDDAVVIQVH